VAGELEQQRAADGAVARPGVQGRDPFVAAVGALLAAEPGRLYVIGEPIWLPST